jgi:tetratricopeptide (TPR) repeat protein
VSRIVGKTLDNRYLIQSILGLGGVTVVYKALDTRLNRPVVIKMLHVEFVDDSKKLLRFQRGARAASVLSHPNVLTLHDCVLSESGSCYLVMDFVEGTTLAAEIGYRGAVGIERGIRIFLQVCDALAHAHERKIVHRNLKPSNILLTKNADGSEKVLLSDFGIAKQLVGAGESAQKVTSTGQWVGSPLYMSPEQAQGKDVDARSDIFSLGKVMLEAFRGKLPILADSILGSTDSGRTPDRAHPEYSDPIPAPLKEIMSKCLQKDPKARFQSVKELRRELDRLLGKQSSSGLSLSMASTIWWNRAGASFKLVLAIVILVVVAVATIAWLNLTLPGKIELARLSLMQQELSGHASDPKLRDLYIALGDLLVQSGKFGDAKGCYLRAEMMTAADSRTDPVKRMEILSKIVKTCALTGDKSYAVTAATKACEIVDFQRKSLVFSANKAELGKLSKLRLAIAGSAFGEQSEEYMQSLLIASAVAVDEERFKDARQLLEKVINTARSKPVLQDRAYYLWASIDLSAVYCGLGRWKLAEGLLKQTVSESSKRYGPNSSYAISALTRLGMLYRDQGRLDESIPVLRQALNASYEADLLEQSWPIVAGLAASYRAKKNYTACQNLLEPQVALASARPGKGSPEWIGAASMLADVYIERRELQKARKLLLALEASAAASKQLSINERLEVGILLVNLDMSNGNFKAAQQRLERLLGEIDAQTFVRAAIRSEVLTKLAFCYAANKRWQDADSTYRRVMQVDESAAALTRTKLAHDSELYVQFLRQIGRNEDAADRKARTARILAQIK